MFNDVCVEYMVKKKDTFLDWIKKVGIIVVGLFLATLVIDFVTFNPTGRPFMSLGYLIAIGILYLSYYFVRNTNVEYEYILTNGDMDIDKIMAKNSRKRVISLKCNEFEAFGKYTLGDEKNKTYDVKITACDSLDSDNLYYCVARSSKHGRAFVIFNANERVLTAIKPFISKEFKI